MHTFERDLRAHGASQQHDRAAHDEAMYAPQVSLAIYFKSRREKTIVDADQQHADVERAGQGWRTTLLRADG